MNRFARHSLCLVALLAVAPVAAADKPRLINVTGQAEIRVVPDEVVVSLGVETTDPILEKAKAENDETVNAILEVTRGLGIGREHVGTDYVGIEPIHKWTNGAHRFIHYQVRKTLVITLREIDTFETLLSATLEAGASHVHGVDFRTTELRKHRDRARALAIVAAKEKARDLAGELGETVGRVHSINEGHGRWWSWYGSWWGGSRGTRIHQNVVQNAGPPSGGGDGPTSPGQIGIDASVTVQFELAG